MVFRTAMFSTLLLILMMGCAARSRRIAERGPKQEVRVVNTCGSEMRVYVDDEIKMRGQLLDISAVLPPGNYTKKNLYAGEHRVVMFPTASGGSARQLSFRVTGPARIRICS